MARNRHGNKKLHQPITPGNRYIANEIHKWAVDGNANKLAIKLRENYIQYWSNFFIFNHKGLENVKQQIIDRLSHNGGCGVMYLKATDTFIVMDLANYTQTLDLKINEATLILVVVGDSKTAKGKHMKDFVIVTADRYVRPWLINSDEFIKSIVHCFDTLKLNRINSQKTKLIEVNRATPAKNAEVKSIYASGEPFVVIQGEIDNVHDLSMKNDEALIWEDLWNTKEWWDYLEGVRHNSLDKKAEVKEVEAKNDSMMFVAMENQKVQVIKDMVENLNEFYGLSIEVETLVEKSEREAKEQQNAMQDEGETQNE